MLAACIGVVVTVMMFLIVEAMAQVGGLIGCIGVVVMVMMFLWNKLDKRFDDLETRENR